MQNTRKLLHLTLALGILIAIGANFFAGALAAPNAIDDCEAKARILSPVPGATVNGIVQIEGTAALGDFVRYELAVAPNGTQAFGNIGGGQQPIVNGQLGVWDSASVVDGAYAIRLRVVDITSNYCEAFVGNINVRNSGPTEIPTPAETPTPQETEAPPIQNAVPTPVPTTPAAGTPAASVTAPRPAPSRTPEAGSGGIGGIEIDQIVQAATDFFAALGRIFLFGVLAMAGIFFFVGVIYFVRRVL